MNIDNTEHQNGRKHLLLAAGILLFFTVVSVFSINQYQYGTADQTITIPFLKQFIHPELYPNDYLLTQRSYYYTYLWDGLGILNGVFGVDLPALFFIVYIISLCGSFLGIYLIANLLFRKPEVAFLAMFFFLFSKGVLGAVMTLDRVLATRTVVLPILLFAIYFYFKKQYYWSFVLQGIGILIHPMTPAYVIGIILVASIVNLRQIGFGKLLLCYAVLGIIASPILVWEVQHSPQSLRLLAADPGWVELLRLRTSHHSFPFSWGFGAFLPFILLLLVFFVSWRHKPHPDVHRIVVVFMATVLALCMIGIVFSEVVPMPVVWNLQPIRSSQFLILFAMMYFANFYVVEMQAPGNLDRKIAVALLSLGILYKGQGWQHTYGLFLILSAFWIFFVLRFRGRFRFSRVFIWGIVAMVLLLGGRSFPRKIARFSIYNAQESSWLDIQRWAKRNANVKDIFIVPPTMEGFRVESERTIYGDWKDGVFMGFNPDFGRDWYRRMERLGFRNGVPLEKGFGTLTTSDFLSIGDELDGGGSNTRKIYLVTFLTMETLNFPVVYRNDRFVVYEVV